MMGGRSTLPAEPVDQARARFEAVFNGIAPLLPPPSDAVETSDLVVPSSKRRVRVFKPINTTGTLPVGLYIHSGGWYAGSIENEDFLCRNIAENSHIILYSPEYRFSPENPYPAGLEDVCAAYEFMHENAPTHGGDPGQRYIMGGSAGGNLTAAVSLKYATDLDLKARGLCIFVPATCEPSVLPDEYRARYTPDLYADAPMIGNELLTQARGESRPNPIPTSFVKATVCSHRCSSQ
jgi:acetyl esterase/lipase